MITADVAIYPLKTNSASEVITDSIDTLKKKRVDYSVSSLSTRLTGSKEEVFSSLSDMFSKAEGSGGEISMVVTISNSAH
ncbi:YKOF-related protein [Anaerobacterium chartisolvens]|uniref:YKOF-related protein n=1 Tax=Anaerobacterium chartisolvens TaxID=1297424 RepID=A0A369BII1_9FIRM|nr:YkoF family thiamine/hydroxymethylpyrimidine-binding protein [Anaerobacterium chartisolvens]RCX20985.1 YKOF-related protein [Anaerobacterium chartisolvens]